MRQFMRGTRWPRRLVAYILIALVMIFLAIFLIAAVSINYVNPTSTEDRTNVLQVIAQIAGGTFLAFSFIFTVLNVVFNREGQIGERMTRAINQLGATDDAGQPALEIRLGAIYALERIASDSRRDHWPIMEVFTAYLRQHAHRQPVDPDPMPLTAHEEAKEESRAMFEAALPGGPRLRADVQAILTVIGRTAHSAGAQRRRVLDLTGVDLRHADLTGAQRMGAWMRDVDLRAAVLYGANLDGAFLGGAALTGVSFSGARLGGVILTGSDLERAVFSEVNPDGVNFSNIGLRHSYFNEASLRKASFVGAKLDRANFANADLRDASFNGASLDRA